VRGWFDVHNDQWQLKSQNVFFRVLESVQARVIAQTNQTNPESGAGFRLEPISETIESGGAVGALCQAFGLSVFERDVLVLCAGVGLHSDLALAVSQLRGNPTLFQPTFAIALATLAVDPEHPELRLSTSEVESAFMASGALRKFKLLDFSSDAPSSLEVDRHYRGLVIDERILDFLLGLDSFPRGLRGFKPMLRDSLLPASLEERAARAAMAWADVSRLPIVHVVNTFGAVSLETKRDAAAFIAAQHSLRLFELNAAELPSGEALETLALLWNREVLLEPAALILNASEIESEAPKLEMLDRFVNLLKGYVLVFSREPRAFERPSLTLNLEKPSALEQRDIWRQAWIPEFRRLYPRQRFDWSLHHGFLTGVRAGLNRLTNQFDLDVSTIRQVVQSARNDLPTHDEPLEGTPRVVQASVTAVFDASWRALQNLTRPKMGNLAQVVTPRVSWDNLILAQDEVALLQMLTAHTRERLNVYQTLGWARDGSRGLGITALFGGPSGTGKTLAAEVIAHDLNLDLIKIDLSSVISKYIGETEKNLSKVFDAAENGGAILFFDEGDALFGKRGEVSDSSDRYANIEVAYLLQRMESFRGLAILTTNLENSLDEAFLRRLRFVVRFAIPEKELRERIWRSVFPKDTPLVDLNYNLLSNLEVPGGSIRNIALNATFTASSRGEKVNMQHLLWSARSEIRKLKRLLRDHETANWE
jgi:hypothetical protein